MEKPDEFFLERDGTIEGPYTIAHINRMRQSGKIEASTPCRRSNEISFRRLDQVLPHLKVREPGAAERIAEVQRKVDDHEVRSLTLLGFGASGLFWVPLGLVASLLAVSAGIIVVTKYRRAIGFGMIAAGLISLAIRVFMRLR